MDWYSRKVLSGRLSNTPDADFCIQALEAAIQDYGCPEIFNTDQGAQFTAEAWICILKNHGLQISMDGKGRYHDNIFTPLFTIYKMSHCSYHVLGTVQAPESLPQLV